MITKGFSQVLAFAGGLGFGIWMQSIPANIFMTAVLLIISMFIKKDDKP